MNKDETVSIWMVGELFAQWKHYNQEDCPNAVLVEGYEYGGNSMILIACDPLDGMGKMIVLGKTRREALDKLMELMRINE